MKLSSLLKKIFFPTQKYVLRNRIEDLKVILKDMFSYFQDYIKAINPKTFITGIDKIHQKCKCISGRIVNGIRGTTFYSFAFDKTPGNKIHKKLLKKVKKNMF